MMSSSSSSSPLSLKSTALASLTSCSSDAERSTSMTSVVAGRIYSTRCSWRHDRCSRNVPWRCAFTFVPFFFPVSLSFLNLSGAIQSICRTFSMSTISTPSSGSLEYTSSSPSFSLSFSFFFSDGAVVCVRPAPSFAYPSAPEGCGTIGAKLERGAVRRPDIPARAGPMANGPLAVISTASSAMYSSRGHKAIFGGVTPRRHGAYRREPLHLRDLLRTCFSAAASHNPPPPSCSIPVSTTRIILHDGIHIAIIADDCGERRGDLRVIFDQSVRRVQSDSNEFSAAGCSIQRHGARRLKTTTTRS
ncbi:hypothetical protein C8Q74DRAFT_320908 [Fomes fomentarius]|nr:hypothetical protein C8Q74DRAFT_320908 [Fomes fomentarius]